MANSADPDQLASKKPTDLDLHCLQRQSISGFSRTRVNPLTILVFNFIKSILLPADMSNKLLDGRQTV